MYVHLGMAECRVSSSVTVTLTSDLVARIFIVSGAYLLYSSGRNSKFGVCKHLGMT